MKRIFISALLLGLGLTGPRDVRADCWVVGRYDNGEPVVECDDDSNISAPICDPRSSYGCRGNEIPNPQPGNQRRLPFQGGVPGSAGGPPPSNAAGTTPQGAAGPPPFGAGGSIRPNTAAGTFRR